MALNEIKPGMWWMCMLCFWI